MIDLVVQEGKAMEYLGWFAAEQQLVKDCKSEDEYKTRRAGTPPFDTIFYRERTMPFLADVGLRLWPSGALTAALQRHAADITDEATANTRVCRLLRLATLQELRQTLAESPGGYDDSTHRAFLQRAAEALAHAVEASNSLPQTCVATIRRFAARVARMRPHEAMRALALLSDFTHQLECCRPGPREHQ